MPDDRSVASRPAPLISRSASAAAVLLALAGMAGCSDDPTGPARTGPAQIEFLTYPAEVEPGGTALLTLLGSLPSPCHELTDVSAVLDDGRIRLEARWRTAGGPPCLGVVVPFQAQVGVAVPAGPDSLALTVADSVWDRMAVVAAPSGVRKGAGELGPVGPVEPGAECHRGLTAASGVVVLLDEPLVLSSAFVVGRLRDEAPEACAGFDPGSAELLGTLEVEVAY